jgi:hypothetical protein
MRLSPLFPLEKLGFSLTHNMDDELVHAEFKL